MGEFKEYASIVTNSTNFLKSSTQLRRGVRCLLLKEYLPLSPRERSELAPSPSYSFLYLGIRYLVLVVVHEPRTKYVAIVPRRLLNSATRKSHSSMKRTRVVHVAPWMTAVIHCVPASTLDDVHEPRTSVLSSSPCSCTVPKIRLTKEKDTRDE